MRKIEFRGYNRKNNEWLHGFYLQNRGAHFVCPDEFATGKEWDDYEIDIDTLGQFAGREGVFEGDIVLGHKVGENMEEPDEWHVQWAVCGFLAVRNKFHDLRDYCPLSEIRIDKVTGNIYNL